MNLAQYFPESITVTDQIIDISGFSAVWKNNVVALAEQIFDQYRKSDQKRCIVAFGGPSGTGKSLTAAVVERLLNKAQSDVRVLTVSQDAYHYSQEYLNKNLDESGEQLARYKGRFDTYDTVSMKHDLELFIQGNEMMFPLYSRQIHNPISNAVECKDESALLIFEGLWLLYDKKSWSDFLPLYTVSIFFNAPEDIRKQNTIGRHVRGAAHSLEEAQNFYTHSDAKNAELLLNNISQHNFDFSFDTLS